MIPSLFILLLLSPTKGSEPHTKHQIQLSAEYGWSSPSDNELDDHLRPNLSLAWFPGKWGVEIAYDFKTDYKNAADTHTQFSGEFESIRLGAAYIYNSWLSAGAGLGDSTYLLRTHPHLCHDLDPDTCTGTTSWTKISGYLGLRVHFNRFTGLAVRYNYMPGLDRPYNSDHILDLYLGFRLTLPFGG